MEHESDTDINSVWCANDSIIKIGQNTKKSPGDSRRLQLQWKTIC